MAKGGRAFHYILILPYMAAKLRIEFILSAVEVLQSLTQLTQGERPTF